MLLSWNELLAVNSCWTCTWNSKNWKSATARERKKVNSMRLSIHCCPLATEDVLMHYNALQQTAHKSFNYNTKSKSFNFKEHFTFDKLEKELFDKVLQKDDGIFSTWCVYWTSLPMEQLTQAMNTICIYIERNFLSCQRNKVNKEWIWKKKCHLFGDFVS